jgi:acyl dehydratase
MKLNRNFLGKEYFTEPYRVEAESIRKYALATNEENPRYLESDAELIVPPIYSVVFARGMLEQLIDDAEEMNLDFLRVVHAGQTMRWKDTVHIGDEIYTTAKIVNMDHLGPHEVLDILIQCKREDKLVVEMDYRIIVRGKEKAGTKRAAKETSEPERGDVLAKQSRAVAANQGVRYADASGDHNPIHVSDEIARKAGLPSAILHGLCTMAMASQAIVDELLDGNPTRLKSMGVRFSRPVLMNQTITTEVYEGGVSEDGLRVVHFETRDANDVPVLTLGTAEYSE